MKDKNVRKFIIVILLLLVVLVSGTTYALFTKTVNTEGTITFTTGRRYIGIYGENKENLGLNVTYTFTIENRGVEDASYQITVEDIINTIGRENINYQYTKGTESKNGKLSDGVVDEANLAPGESVTVTITLTSSSSGDYKGKIKVITDEPIVNDIYCTNGEQIEPNAPELRGDMIPVVYNESTSNWEKADINGKWYDYEEQMWANAVTIKDTTKRSQYKSANVGTTINLDDVNTIMVWIPRYSYTLGNTYGYKIDGASEPSWQTPGAFDIKFVGTKTIDTCSGKYEGTEAMNYYTPPSFCWGDTCDDDTKREDSENIELPGIWIAKFELTGTIDDITSLPNQQGIKDQVLSSFFNNIQANMNGVNGETNYGLSGNYDTHMIKNTEWGAFAYLSQSKYGKYGNSNYTGANKEVYVNNYHVSPNSNLIGETKTGCSAGFACGPSSTGRCVASSSCLYTYDVELNGTGASTTGTIYGIYDAVGGLPEHTMVSASVSLPSSGEFSGFSAFPKGRYINFVKDVPKGQGTKPELVAAFYGDSVEFSHSGNNIWKIRGNSYVMSIYTSDAGVFHQYESNGSVGRDTRFVISPW